MPKHIFGSAFLLVFSLLLIETCFAVNAAALSPSGPAEAAKPSVMRNPVALGERYENGESVVKDYRRARALYCEAAQKGDAEAAFNLAWMYLNGRGVPRSDAIAVSWLQKAAKGGVTQAQNLLALLPRKAADNVQANCLDNRIGAVARSSPPPRIRALIDATAGDIGINPALLSSVMAVESGFDPRVVSPKMAAGLMQLMPETAARYGVRDVFDERENVRGGAAYLRDLLQMFKGNLALALAAYDAGPAKVVLHGGIPPYPETENYVAAVKKLCSCE